jgi:hypothetical protein
MKVVVTQFQVRTVDHQENPNQDNRSHRRELNPETPEHESDELASLSEFLSTTITSGYPSTASQPLAQVGL